MSYSNDNNDSLPYVAEVEVSLTDVELQVLKNQYNSELPDPSEQTKFNFAWGLIRSSRRSEQQKGVTLLGDIYRDYASRRRECLYYLALGHLKLGNYGDSKRIIELFLKEEPRNIQGLAILDLIERRVADDGFKGLMIVGGATAALIAGVAMMFRKRD